MKHFLFIGGYKDYINLGSGWGLVGKYTLLTSAEVLRMLHLHEEEF